ncbi:MAG: DUF2628 domain-containing protein [Rickettsiales bacterium]
MKIYTVHVESGSSNSYQKPVFVKEGFNVFAFLFTFLWALYHRLWLAALFIFAVNTALALITKSGFMSADVLGIVQIMFNAMVGFHGNDWIRSALAKRGYIMADITAADSQLRAEQRYFDRHFAQAYT